MYTLLSVYSYNHALEPTSSDVFLATNPVLVFKCCETRGGFHNRPYLTVDCCETSFFFIRGGFHINSSRRRRENFIILPLYNIAPQARKFWQLIGYIQGICIDFWAPQAKIFWSISWPCKTPPLVKLRFSPKGGVLHEYLLIWDVQTLVCRTVYVVVGHQFVFGN